MVLIQWSKAYLAKNMMNVIYPMELIHDAQIQRALFLNVSNNNNLPLNQDRTPTQDSPVQRTHSPNFDYKMQGNHMLNLPMQMTSPRTSPMTFNREQELGGIPPHVQIPIYGMNGPVNHRHHHVQFQL